MDAERSPNGREPRAPVLTNEQEADRLKEENLLLKRKLAEQDAELKQLRRKREGNK
jgi:hypothetical protein